MSCYIGDEIKGGKNRKKTHLSQKKKSLTSVGISLSNQVIGIIIIKNMKNQIIFISKFPIIQQKGLPCNQLYFSYNSI